VDLQAHRATVRDIVGRLGQFTLAMEQFGARESDAQTVSTDLVAGCDLYLGVIAWRYGYVPEGQERSVTHLEYEEAGRLGIPRLVFLAAPETQAAEGPTDLFPGAARDPEHLDQLLAFRAEIERTQVVDYFTTPDDLAKKVAAALYQFLQAHPADAGPRPPRDLPPRAPGFVGREEDLRTLSTALRQGQHMAVSAAVAGMGGVGKSSLAAEVVHTLAAEPNAFPGGITWVRCDDRVGLAGLIWIEDQVLVAWSAPVSAEAAARATTPESSLELREHALRERLRLPDGSAQSAPALVLLDNVERDLPLARLLDTVAPLGITTLLTSRSEPGSPQVRLLRLDVLAPEPAVALFAERFTARGGSWSAERDGATTHTIVETLGGLPLAIELAAARAARTRLPLVALAEELRGEDTLGRLSDPLAPNVSVRYSLGKTLRALSTSQHRHFAALGLLEGPDWALSIVEALLAGMPAGQDEDALAGSSPAARARTDLDALVAYSLVSLSAAQGTEAATMPRVRLHPLVRELAREEWARLPVADQSTALSALLAGAQDWVSEHPDDTARTYATLEQDEELIAGALRTALARQVALPTVIATVTAWHRYLRLRGWRFTQEMSTLELESARALGDRVAELNALSRLLGAAKYLGGRDAEALQYGREALVIARVLGDPVLILEVLGDMAEVLGREEARAPAEQAYEEASAIARALGDQAMDSDALNYLGEIARAARHLEEAVGWYQRALEEAQASGAGLWEVSMIQANLGITFGSLRDVGAAQRYLEEGLATARAAGGNAYSVGGFLVGLAQLALWAGDLETAERELREALPLLEKGSGAGLTLQARGNLALLSGLQAQRRREREAAEQAFEEALRLFDEAGFVPATDQRPFVRQLLAEVREQPAESTAGSVTVPRSESRPLHAAEPLAVGASAPRAKRGWWPWGRK
jgi:tetratricopeptide (TPR) repeat protein